MFSALEFFNDAIDDGDEDPLVTRQMPSQQQENAVQLNKVIVNEEGDDHHHSSVLQRTQPKPIQTSINRTFAIKGGPAGRLCPPPSTCTIRINDVTGKKIAENQAETVISPGKHGNIASHVNSLKKISQRFMITKPEVDTKATYAPITDHLANLLDLPSTSTVRLKEFTSQPVPQVAKEQTVTPPEPQKRSFKTYMRNRSTVKENVREEDAVIEEPAELPDQNHIIYNLSEPKPIQTSTSGSIQILADPAGRLCPPPSTCTIRLNDITDKQSPKLLKEPTTRSLKPLEVIWNDQCMDTEAVESPSEVIKQAGPPVGLRSSSPAPLPRCQCKYCNKVYVGKRATAYLYLHIRRHHNSGPYPCPKCPKQFTQQDNLERHLLQVHPIKVYRANRKVIS